MSDMKIENDCVVALNITLSDGSGNVLNSSEEDGELVYMHGRGNILPGLERELSGRVAGDELTLDLEAQDAFGEKQEQKILQVQKTQLEGNPELGSILSAQIPSGEEVYFRVVGIGENTVTLDGNHPLAGESVHLEVKVMNVRQATEEELAEHEPEECAN